MMIETEVSKTKTITLIWQDAEPPINKPDHWAISAPKLDIHLDGFESAEDIYPVMYAGLKFAEGLLTRPKIHVHTPPPAPPDVETLSPNPARQHESLKG